MFINREKELRFLKDKWKNEKHEFIVFYGNRRVGKTYLLKHFIKNNVNSFYFLSEEGSNVENVSRFQKELASCLNDVFLNKIELKDFYSVFEYFIKENKDRKFVFVIDEFSYLIENDKSILSHFQSIIDELLVNTNIMLVVCGSSFSIMINEVLNKKSPLYGRRTASFQLNDMELKYFSKFFPKFTKEDLIKTYSVIGGTTQYLRVFENELSLKENIKKHILSKSGFLHEEVSFLLSQSFRNSHTYSSILKSISQGNNSFSVIVNKTGIDKSSISKYLEILEKLNFIEKKRSMFFSANTKNIRYFVKNIFFRFYFYFLDDKKSMLSLEKISSLYELIDNEFDKYFSRIFEDICRNYLLERVDFLDIGSYWYKDLEIDIVGYTQNEVYFGEVKWTKRKVGFELYNDLLEKVQRVKVSQSLNKKYVLFSKSGFDKKLIDYVKDNQLDNKIFLYDMSIFNNYFK